MSNPVLRTLVTAGVSAGASAVVVLLLGLAVPELIGVFLVVVAVAMLAYGIFAGVLGSYDLTTGTGWLTLLIDVTWALPSTLLGAVVANAIYPFFGRPSATASAGQHWIVYLPPPGGSGFGTNVLQTVGTINLGGAGQHERMHLLQARIFGPAYLPLIVVSYVVTGALQLLFMLPLGLILWAAKVRTTPYLRPPAHSAVQGFFGWIYYATPFEVWAYASGNP